MVVPDAIKDSLRTVSLSDNEFHSVIDSPFSNRTKPRGKVPALQQCVNIAVANVISQIKGRKYYDPMFLTDAVMNIDKYGEAVKEDFWIQGRGLNSGEPFGRSFLKERAS